MARRRGRTIAKTQFVSEDAIPVSEGADQKPKTTSPSEKEHYATNNASQSCQRAGAEPTITEDSGESPQRNHPQRENPTQETAPQASERPQGRESEAADGAPSDGLSETGDCGAESDNHVQLPISSVGGESGGEYNGLRRSDLRALRRDIRKLAVIPSTLEQRRKILDWIHGAADRQSASPKMLIAAAKTALEVERLNLDAAIRALELSRGRGPQVAVQVNVENKLAGLIEAAERRQRGEER